MQNQYGILQHGCIAIFANVDGFTAYQVQPKRDKRLLLTSSDRKSSLVIGFLPECELYRTRKPLGDAVIRIHPPIPQKRPMRPRKLNLLQITIHNDGFFLRFSRRALVMHDLPWLGLRHKRLPPKLNPIARHRLASRIQNSLDANTIRRADVTHPFATVQRATAASTPTRHVAISQARIFHAGCQPIAVG